MNKHSNITILFPGIPNNPVGGYKIAYQYADYLASIGYNIRFVYPYVKQDFFRKSDISRFLKLKTFIGFYYRKLRNQIKLNNWYPFKNKTSYKIVFMLSPFFYDF